MGCVVVCTPVRVLVAGRMMHVVEPFVFGSSGVRLESEHSDLVLQRGLAAGV